MQLIKTDAQGKRSARFYELDDVCKATDYHIGLLIMYICASHLSRILENVGLRDTDMNMYVYTSSDFFKMFPTFSQFHSEFASKDIESIAVKMTVTDRKTNEPFPVFLAGKKDLAELIVYYPADREVFVDSTLKTVEKETFSWHSFPKDAVQNMMRCFGIDEKNAVLSLEKISRHEDIRKEFLSGISENGYRYPEHPGSIRDQTAEMFKNSYNVNVLGSYDLLIFLRENSDQEPYQLSTLQTQR